MKRILFICTGNYYRSRFAELLFAALAREHNLDWQADSRGTSVVSLGHYNVGPLSIHAQTALQALGIQVDDPRHPQQLVFEDLAEADLIVAACEEEHRPLLEGDFPTMAARVEYLQVQDLAFTPPDQALAALEQAIRRVVDRLRHAPQPTRAAESD